MPERSLHSAEDFLRRAVELLRAEMPEAYAGMCSALALRSVVVTLDGEELFFRFGRLNMELVAALEAPSVRIGSDSATVLDAVDARLSLDEAVRQGRLVAMGDRKDLRDCHEAFLFFVRGAVRCPSFPPLLVRFRQERGG